ncbi:MAG: single-stranded DNA-binding protein [Ferruginibacter sp.]|nr:single-stranded DNA-binding protein [Ferruginibacter sp.]
MIKLQIVGNLGKDCIVKEVNGKNVINFSVVHSEKFKDNQGNPKERATWVECAYWTDKTGVAPYLTRGKTVYAEGYPEADAYMNKDNQPTGTLRMRVMSLQLVSGGAGGENSAQNTGASSAPSYSQPSSTSSPIASVPAADDLPF